MPFLFLISCSSSSLFQLNFNESRLSVAPVGFTKFCVRNPDQCKPDDPKYVALSEMQWDQLVDVNHYYNGAIKPKSDQDLYGTSERWVVPTNYGDCEDYVLAKRAHLLALGWPAGALRVAVVKQYSRSDWPEDHAVLLVTSSKGHFVLDNLTNRVKRWEEVDYEWRYVQSPEHPLVWQGVNKVLASN